MNLANAAGAAFRADANNSLAALVSNSSGATEPSTMFAYQFWADTTSGLLKQRNAANTAWVTVGTMASANLGLQPYDVDIPTVSATQEEMEAGTEAALRSMSPLRVKQAITANITTINRLINGDMRIAQRGTSSAAQGYSTVDRFYINRNGSVPGISMSQVYGAFGAPKHCLSVQRDSGNTATNNIGIYQPIEISNSRNLAGGDVTLSFQIGAGGGAFAGAHYASLYYQTGTTDIGVSGSWTLISQQEFTIVAGTSFTKKSFTWAVPSDATQVQVAVFLNVSGTAGGDDRYYLTEFQLEQGSTATTFQHRDIGTELTLCQRYYEKSYNLNNTPGTHAGAWTSVAINAVDFYDYGRVRFSARKRTTPTVTTYSPATGDPSASFSLSSQDNRNCYARNHSETGCEFFSDNMSANHAMRAHWTASAEL